MTKREQELLLELLLIRSRYSAQEMRAVHHALRSRLPSNSVAELLDLVVAVDEAFARPRGAKTSAQDPRSLKAKFISRLRDSKKMPSKNLTPIAQGLGIEIAENRDETVRLIEQRIASLSMAEFDQFLSDLSQTGADASYLNLAHFLIDQRR